MSRIAFAILLLSAPLAAQDLASTLPVVVTVGEATLPRAPDRAFVTASAEARARSPRDAQRQNADAMAAVQKRLADARVPKESMRTTGSGRALCTHRVGTYRASHRSSPSAIS